MDEVIDVGENAVVVAQAAPVSLFRTDDPTEIVARATSVANALSAVIEDRKLYKMIQGKRHVVVEGWTLLGSMLGVFPVCEWSRKIEDGWEARVVARTMAGVTVGAAEALCSHDESLWSNRDEFALRSMSQTRATSKCLRIPLGFIMSLAGYATTPAEEMDGIEPREERPVRRAPDKPQARPGKRQEPPSADEPNENNWLMERVGFGSKVTKLGTLGEVVPKDLKWHEFLNGATQDGRRYGWLVDGLEWCKNTDNPGAVVKLFMSRAPGAITWIEAHSKAVNASA